jgi:shikimate kinase
MEKRYPVYAEADVTILSEELPHDVMVQAALDALARHLGANPVSPVGNEAAP